MTIPDDCLYTKEHEWVRINGNSAVMGITDFAQSQLGDITYVELPEEETEAEMDEVLLELESVKAASDIYAPVSGTVVRVNEELEGAPELLNSDPYGDGWICELELTKPEEKDRLMNAASYRKFIKDLES
jgi:glycine cleavage system H protein